MHSTIVIVEIIDHRCRDSNHHDADVYKNPYVHTGRQIQPDALSRYKNKICGRAFSGNIVIELIPIHINVLKYRCQLSAKTSIASGVFMYLYSELSLKAMGDSCKTVIRLD